MDIVIAKYKEDVSWIDKLLNSNNNLFIYNKDKEDLRWKFNLENWGKDPQTFLYHIINNWETLGEWVVFLQGNPFEHSKDVLNIINEFNYKESFKPLGASYIRDNQNILEMTEKWLGDIKLSNIDRPIKFISGMQCIVKRDLIKKRSLQEYKEIYDSIPKIISKSSSQNDNSINLWYIEYTWPNILGFNKQLKV